MKNLLTITILLLLLVLMMNFNEKLDEKKPPNSCRLTSEQQKESMINEYNREF